MAIVGGGIDVSTSITGDKELIKKFQKLGSRKLQISVMRSGLRKSNKIIKARMKQVIRSRGAVVTGALEHAVDDKIKVYKDDVWSAVGIRGGRRGQYVSSVRKTKTGIIQPSKYWHLVVKGTKPHVYNGPMPVFAGGRIIWFQSPPAVHPGAKKNPIIKITAERSLKEAGQVGAKEIKRRIEKEASR